MERVHKPPVCGGSAQVAGPGCFQPRVYLFRQRDRVRDEVVEVYEDGREEECVQPRSIGCASECACESASRSPASPLERGRDGGSDRAGSDRARGQRTKVQGVRVGTAIMSVDECPYTPG